MSWQQNKDNGNPYPKPFFNFFLIMTIEIHPKEILHLLEASINHKFNEQISKVILMHIQKDDMAMAQVFKSFLGIVPTTDFKIGDKVLVKMSDLPTWRMNVQNMQDKNMVHKHHLPCVVSKIDLTKKHNLTVTFTYIDKNEVAETDSYDVSDIDVVLDDAIFYEKIEENPLPF